jgi:alginate O-acetyltransferase complex protein AlgJ
MENRTGIRKIEDAALIVCFIIAILLPGAGLILKMDGSSARQENRQLSPFPPLSLEADELTAFPERFNLYFNDHFGFRSALIRGQALAKVQWLKVSSSADVICGKADWLFYASEDSIASYRAMQPFSEEQLKSWKRALEGRRRWLAQRNVRYIFTVAPDKHTIYPEYMPEQIRPVREASRLDQLIGYLKENSEVEVLDLRPVLLSAKRRHPIYYQTDTHWNDYGALVAYQAIARAMSQTLPAIQPLREADFELQTGRLPGGDLAGMLGLADVLWESTVSLHPRQPFRASAANQPLDRRLIESGATFASEQRNSQLPRMVMFRDSFANRLIPFLAENFSRAVYVWDKGFQLALIEQERPDIVLDEMAERKLMGVPPDDLPGSDEEPRYEGSHDSANCEAISGWAWDAAHPEAVVTVDIYEDQRLIASLAAASFRPDLLEAGKGNGYHAFVYTPAARLADGRPHAITVKINGTASSLSNTPKTLLCASPKRRK